MLISENDTIGKFYDKVSRTIAGRKHTEYHTASGVYEGVDQERLWKIINWQYTKELAYQMFLNGTLTLTHCDEYGVDRIHYAKKRAFTVLCERGESFSDDKEIDTALYLAVSHFASGNDEAIEFAHKTVYEYFTAVKLYEDYFAKFNKDYFAKTDFNQAVEDVWNNIISAFRYVSIPKEIFNYLNEMQLSIYNGSVGDENGFDYNNFEKCYVEGMKKHILSDIVITKPLNEYKIGYTLVNNQVSCAFRNLTWFLTGHGFCNKDDIAECKNIGEIISPQYTDINCYKWKMNKAVLENVNLQKANFREASLIKANLKNTDLRNANFFDAILTRADFEEADVRSSDLRTKHLVDAYINRAKYCIDDDNESTQFLDDFNPQEYRMNGYDSMGFPIL